MEFMNVPSEFISQISEANGLDTERASKDLDAKDATAKKEADVAVNEEDITPLEILAYLKEEYGVTIEDESAVATLVEFCNDFAVAYSDRIDEAGEDESEIEIDLDAMKTALFEDYDLDVDDVETVRGLIKFAYDYHSTPSE